MVAGDANVAFPSTGIYASAPYAQYATKKPVDILSTGTNALLSAVPTKIATYAGFSGATKTDPQYNSWAYDASQTPPAKFGAGCT